MVYLSSCQQVFHAIFTKRKISYYFRRPSYCYGFFHLFKRNYRYEIRNRKINNFFFIPLFYSFSSLCFITPKTHLLKSFGNLRSIVMQPVGHIAGIASAITGLISTLMAVPISIFIGKYVSNTALPFFFRLFNLFLFININSILY